MTTEASLNLPSNKESASREIRVETREIELIKLQTHIQNLESEIEDLTQQSQLEILQLSQTNSALKHDSDVTMEMLSSTLAKSKSQVVSQVVTRPRVGDMNAQGVNSASSKDTQNLRVAAIMDEFTGAAFDRACVLLRPSLATWRQELEEFCPDFLLVESAWDGNSGQWNGKINRVSQELLDLIHWCRANSVPTVLWNKEDPVHFNSFVSSASLFDSVFTTDIDSIERYKSLLGHERVFVLPFFCEPGLHNPLKSVERSNGFSFAGAYYKRYAERQQNFDSIISGIQDLGPVTIYDRNFGRNLPEFEFPEKYKDLIKGSLPFEEIEKSYKGFDFGINMNSVKQSQSMFARRIFDLLLSNTHAVSNYSRGLRLMFGDLVISTDDTLEIRKRVSSLIGEDGSTARDTYAAFVRLSALRKVIRQHSTAVRLEYIASKIWIDAPRTRREQVSVFSAVSDVTELDQVLSSFESQLWANKELIIILVGNLRISPEHRRSSVRYISGLDPKEILGNLTAATFSSFWDPNSKYGPNFLWDAVDAFGFADATGVSMISEPNDALGLGASYSESTGGPRSSTVVRTGKFTDSPAMEIIKGLESNRLNGGLFINIPSFDFAPQGNNIFDVSIWESELRLGIDISELHKTAEDIPRNQTNQTFAAGWHEGDLFANFTPGIKSANIEVVHMRNGIRVISNLESQEHEYLYSKDSIKLPDSWSDGNSQPVIHVLCSPGLVTSAVIIYLDSTGTRVGSQILHANSNQILSIPEGTQACKLGLRCQGSGSTDIGGIAFESITPPVRATPLLDTGKQLVLTNVYPSATALYRNGFVHSRVRSYVESGLRPTVFAMNGRVGAHTYEFEGIDVLVGGDHELEMLLKSNEYDSILVHFLDKNMWNILQHHYSQTPVIVWIHGAEIQPWHRRDFNYNNEAERDSAKVLSDSRMSFWREVLPIRHPNLHFVFVSKYFAQEVMEDTGVALSADQYSIIHNFVDTNIFDYQKKDTSFRYRLLSIRPFASHKYANDLTVSAILMLKDHPLFEECEILILGDGPLFDSTLKPLEGISNVRFERRFMSQHEISRIHDDYGVFLTPTRMDSQGVSRDEAMSSGLVPVTNAVTAIPEFVDTSCAVLAPGDDFAAMAAGIIRLWEDPDLFLSMSEEASARVRRQSAFGETIGREISLVRSFAHTFSDAVIT